MRLAKNILSVTLTAAAISFGPFGSEASGQYRSRNRPSYRSYRSYRPGRSYRPYRPYQPYYRLHYRPLYYPSSYYGGYYMGQRAAYSYYHGSVQTKVKPVETEVYVDGYYSGIVDDFDGIFQRLYLSPGEHEIELRLAGYRNYSQSLLVNPGHKYKIHHQMEQLGPGDKNPPPIEPREPERYEEPETREPFRTEPDRTPARESEIREEELRVPQREEASRPEPPRPPARQITSARFGKLSIHAQPADAEIVIDGDPWGSLEGLEALVIHLPAGRHRIEIRREGYESFVTEVEIRENETTPLNVRLDI